MEHIQGCTAERAAEYRRLKARQDAEAARREAEAAAVEAEARANSDAQARARAAAEEQARIADLFERGRVKGRREARETYVHHSF